MPNYTYICDFCNYKFDIRHSILANKLTKCPKCKKNTLYREIGAGTCIIFKGNGFYETDYKNK